jgi:ABC-type antimicrobial peptide transport system permease subunit
MNWLTAIGPARIRSANDCRSFVAGALAAGGIYGVMSYTVTQRTPEMGIRMALGADRLDIMKLVTLSEARLAVLGIAIGVVAAVISSRLISSLLFGVTATDPFESCSNQPCVRFL